MLNVRKTRKVVGEFTFGGVKVKELTAEIDENAVTTTYCFVIDKKLYDTNRREIRKEEKQFDELIYSIEDEIIAEKEKATKVTE